MNDQRLGSEIEKLLVDRGLETPMTQGSMKIPYGDSRQKYIEGCFSNIMDALGLDLGDDSLVKTPHRVAKMYCTEIFYGLDYTSFPACTTIENKMGVSEMVATNCTVKSMCEHHWIPFIGMAYIGYIPDKKLLGLSKFNRIVDFFSRRPSVQERLTEQVSVTLKHVLQTEDVAVVIQAKHFCVALRGAQDHVSYTTTSSMGGKFFTVGELRSEFLALSRSNPRSPV